MSVDVNRGEKLPIHINMTFLALPCEGLFPALLNWTVVPVILSLCMDPLLYFGLLSVQGLHA